MTEHYVNVRMNKSYEIIHLVYPIRLSGPVEMGVVEFVIDGQIHNISNRDVIKIAKHEQVKHMKLRLKPERVLGAALSGRFKNAGLVKSWAKYENERFVVFVETEYIMLLSPELAADLGLPTQISGLVKGLPVGRVYNGDTRLEELRFFKSTPVKRYYHVRSGYYKDAEAIRAEFSKLGIQFDANGSVSIPPNRVDTAIVSPDLQLKLRYGAPIHYLFLRSDMLEHGNVGDKEYPLLRIIPGGWNGGTFTSIQYKRLRRYTELDSICLDISDDTGRPVNFTGCINLTLHIRHVSS